MCKMTDIIVTFKIKDFIDEENKEETCEDMNDMLREIAQKNDMDLISWGVI